MTVSSTAPGTDAIQVGCSIWGQISLTTPSVHLVVIQSLRRYLLRLFSESCSPLGRQDATWENVLWKNEAPACASHSSNGQKECVVDSISPRHLVKDLICWGGQFAPRDFTCWNTDWAHNPERSRVPDAYLETPLVKVTSCTFSAAFPKKSWSQKACRVPHNLTVSSSGYLNM